MLVVLMLMRITSVFISLPVYELPPRVSFPFPFEFKVVGFSTSFRVYMLNVLIYGYIDLKYFRQVGL